MINRHIEGWGYYPGLSIQERTIAAAEAKPIAERAIKLFDEVFSVMDENNLCPQDKLEELNRVGGALEEVVDMLKRAAEGDLL